MVPNPSDREPFVGLIIAILIGAIAGWLAGLIVRGGGFGFLGNVVLGIVGAVVASYALPAIGLHMGGGFFDSVLSAMIGAIIVLVVIRLVKKA
ncbi:MAG: GlsB/YeaQ/YmgE family stress response membrane protein [Mangrovicoccus sp.]|nr:GlsB/YeaQ/YmgE family stress response membrane protein [Mangrovicoccus sp.]